MRLLSGTKYPTFGNHTTWRSIPCSQLVECIIGLGIKSYRAMRISRLFIGHWCYGNAGANTQRSWPMPAPEEIKAMGTKVVVKINMATLFGDVWKIAGENPYIYPMKIYPAALLHNGRIVGWLQPGNQYTRFTFICIGEANFQTMEPIVWNCICVDAGVGWWVFCSALYHRSVLANEMNRDISTQLPALWRSWKANTGEDRSTNECKGKSKVLRVFTEDLAKSCGVLVCRETPKALVAEGRKLIRQLRDEFYKDVYVGKFRRIQSRIGKSISGSWFSLNWENSWW